MSNDYIGSLYPSSGGGSFDPSSMETVTDPVTLIYPQGQIASGNTGLVTGDQVYTALQSAGRDEYVIVPRKINRGLGRTPLLTFKAYKNGAVLAGQTFSVDLKYVDNGGYTITTATCSVTSDNSGYISIGTAQISTLATIFDNVEITQFYVIFSISSNVVYCVELNHYIQGSVLSDNKGFVTGGQVYTALQSAGNDVWEVMWPRVQKVTFSGTYLSGYLYKNGVVYSGSIYYDTRYGETSGGNAGNYGTATASSTGKIELSLGAESIYNNNSYRYFAADLYSDSNKTKYLTSIFVTRALTASAIASGDSGYVTGDQVYAAIGNIETLLASI